MKGYFILFTFFLNISVSYPQINFQRTIGGPTTDIGWAVESTVDGGYIIGAYKYAFVTGNYDMYLIKTDSIGDTLWTKIYGGASDDFCYAIDQTSDGGYIVAGMTYSYGSGNGDIYLIKTNSIGDTLWTKAYGGDSMDLCYAVKQTNDNGYIVAGYTGSFGSGGNDDAYLIKTDSIGDTLWTRTFGGNFNDWLFSVSQTFDGGYITGGITASFGAGGAADMYLIKTDPLGDTLWTKAYGGISTDFCYAMQQTSDGGYILAGMTDSYGPGNGNMYLIKTDSTGDTLWTKVYGGSNTEIGWAVKQTSDGGYIITGQTSSYGAGNDDVCLIKTNPDGVIIWAKTYGGSADDLGYAVDQTNSGEYVIIGNTNSFGVSDEIYFIKTDSNGNSGCKEIDIFPVDTVGGIVSNTNTIVGSGTVINNTTTLQYFSSTNVYDLCIPPNADFTASDTIICAGNCINFTDLSANTPTAWQWMLSGALPSSSGLTDPMNICYNSAGIYNVTLIVFNSDGSDTLTIDSFITVNICPGMEDLNRNNLIHVYPNPSNDIFSISVKLPSIEHLAIKINNATGQTIHLENVNIYSGQYYKQIDLSGYAKGVYFLEIKTGDTVWHKKLIYQ